jgi:hypothetical protein
MTIFAPPPMSPLPRSVEWFLVRDKSMESRNGLEGYCLGEIRYGVLDSQRICYTHEDEDKQLENGNGRTGKAAIPAGRHRLTLPVHGRNILINAVPGFFHVEIRAESGISRNDGDVAVGDMRTLAGVGNCSFALARLITELRRLTMAGVQVYLNVGRAE